MYVRRPSAVFESCSDVRENFALRNGLPDAKFVQSRFSQMAIEREKFFSRVRRMFQNDKRPIILRNGIVRKKVNDSGQRCADCRARLNEKIDSEMNRPPFIGGIFACPELRRVVQQPRFAISPDGNPRTGFL